MKTQIKSLRTLGLATLLAGFAWLALAYPVSAATNYYPQPTAVPYTQYSQPVYYYYYPPQQPSQVQTLTHLRTQLMQLLAQLQQLQAQYQLRYGHTYYGPGYTGGGSYTYPRSVVDYDIEVETLYARNIEDDEATLYGEVDLDDASYVDVWFEYGEDGDLDEETDEERIYRNDDERFSIDVDGLDDDENYYFRAIAEAPNGDRAYGQIKSFTADNNGSSRDDDEPDVETRSATNITERSAELRGEVEMNDFDDGDVFFVWGEDEDLVEDAEDENRYRDIDEEGDELQKQKVYDNLDGYRTFWLMVYGLDDNTDHYFRICVEYEDEDDDDTLMCGDVEHFETD